MHMKFIALEWLCCPQVKEFDKPSTLLDDPSSMFNKLVEDTGPVASAMLKQMAAAGPEDHEPLASTGGGSCSAAAAARSREASL